MGLCDKCVTKPMKTGPVETIESKGIRIPIYLSPARGRENYVVTYYANGERKRERAGTTLADARAFARDKVDDLTKGTAHIGPLSARQAAVVADSLEVLRAINVPMSQATREYAQAFELLGRQPLVVKAAEFYAAHLEKQKTLHAPVKLPAVVDEFLKAIKAQGRSARYVEDCTSRLSRAKKAFNTYIQRITSSDVEAWLDAIKAAGRTRNNYRSTLCTLFSFARSRGYLPRNERTEAELTMKASDRGGDIGVYTPKELAVMLSGIETKFLPLVALGAFAGLRTAEIHRAEWADVDLHGGHIVVGKRKAKTSQRRIVPILPALRAWLEPLAKPSGHVIPQYSGDAPLLRAFRQALEPLKVELVHNGLRHSFASYRLAIVQSADQVSLEMGTSPKKLFTNYRELATKAQAERWFAVAPAGEEKVAA